MPPRPRPATPAPPRLLATPPPPDLAPWLDAPGRAGVLTDFDGTLSPIVGDPDAAAPLPGVTTLLSALAGRYRLVAVISGRPVAYLLDRLAGAEGVVLSGLYGLEKATDGAVDVLPAAARWRSIVGEVAAAAEAEAPDGVYVERKGLAVVLHFRNRPDHAAWVEDWSGNQAARSGLLAHPAKMAVELLPPVKADKGTVVADLAAGLDAVCFVGDDRGDLPAFAALARLAATGVHTLSVAVRSAETPPELLDQADLAVDGPDGALALLSQLAG